jgi:DNA polymerase III alpha subunit (gram-positive type)
MTIFYLDIECNDLRGSILLQVACISDSNKIFNGFCQVNQELSARCTELTGFFIYKNRLFQHGNELECHPVPEILSKFSEWLINNSDGIIYIVSHNGFGYDFRILLKHFKDHGLTFPGSVRFCDSLLTIKKEYKRELPSYSLGSLAEHFKIKNLQAHNGLSDAITLKRICEEIQNDRGLKTEHFTTNFRFQNSVESK